MKKSLLCAVILLAMCTMAYPRAEISIDLQEKIDQALANNQPVRALVILQDQVDMQALDQKLYAEKASPEYRAYTVITTLQQKAQATQGDLRAYLESQSAEAVLSFEGLWVVNMFLIEATPRVLLEISQRDDVAYMDYDHETVVPKPINQGPAPESSPNGAEPGLKIVNAHKLWELGYTGAGTIVMTRDTGVNGSHPALSARWRGTHVPWNYAWLGNGTFPTDTDGHGTHTMGILTGLDPATNDTIGMAPGAEWIAASFSASVFTSFQWAMNPDGNPATTDDIPVVISNSWGIQNSTGVCYASTYASLFNSVEAAGIAIVFSAGNEGPPSQTITAPKNINTNLVNSWATGAIQGGNPTFPIADFSSRGPSACGGSGSLLIKPEAVAPGVSVRSAYLGTGYQYLSGTSMACPHVSGAVALLKEAFPNKTGQEVKLALYYTAKETGADLSQNDPGEPVGENSGEDHNYGKGLIDVYAAYLFLLLGPPPFAPTNFAAYSDYNTPSSMMLTWDDPTELITGDPLNTADFRILIERDGVLIDSVSGGVGQYSDNGLIDGQEYQYSIFSKVIATHAVSDLAQASWVAGGSPIPDPADNVGIAGDVNQLTFSWENPTKNIDGTPLDDLDGINLYQDGTLVATFSRSPSDTGKADSAIYSPSMAGYYAWQLAVIDNESPSNESELSDSLLTPLSITFTDAFGSPGSPEPNFWFNQDAQIDDRSVNPPSGPYALNLNGTPAGGDIIDLRPVDLTGYPGSGVVFSYQWQPQGIGDPPEPQDSLRVLFKNDQGNWILVRSYGGTDVMPFQLETIDIQSAPNGGGTYFYSQFQVRLHAQVSPHPILPRDDWFVDNVYLGIPDAAIAVSADTVFFDSTIVGTSDTLTLEVQNIGLSALQVTDIVSSNPVFAINRTNFTVSAGTHELVDIVYAPPGSGIHNGVLRIAHNAPNADTIVVILEGRSVVTGIAEGSQLPLRFELSQNYPNPFNPETTIEFAVPQNTRVEIKIFNLLGQQVRELVNDVYPAGTYNSVWDGRNDVGEVAPSGVYFYQMNTETGFQSVKKLLLLK